MLDRGYRILSSNRKRAEAPSLGPRLSHTCARADDGVVIVDVWQSREDFQEMMDDPEFAQKSGSANFALDTLSEVRIQHPA